MELVQPAEISGKIMTIIDEAENELILISPYNKIVRVAHSLNYSWTSMDKIIQIY
ncbi:hypothetical protein [Rubrolithibacter danxiaensis]|uniref:hypothetical protein n=1 Tax=Rubrolithibacter danxiaensis TaxID=3390805 RepID=UPI003BF88A55